MNIKISLCTLSFAALAFLTSCGGENETQNKNTDTVSSIKDTIRKENPPPVIVEKLDPNDTTFEWKKNIEIGGNNGDFALFADGKIAVTTSDAKEGLIRILSAEGKLLKSFGKKGKDKEMFRDGIGSLALAPDGSIYCSDLTKPRILAFDTLGNFKFEIKLPGNDLISGLAVNSKGTLLVSLATGWKLKTYDASGNFVADYKQVKDEGGLIWGYLSGVEVDGEDKIYMCNWQAVRANSAAVHICEADGKYISTAKDFKIDHGTVHFTVDAAGRIYMENTTFIKVFSKDGKQIAKVGNEGKENGQFESESIRRMRADKAGNLYVLDKMGERIQVFK